MEQAGRTAFRRGVVDSLPAVVGVVPFGLIAGVAAVENGLSVGTALALSAGLFAGASQLAALDLLARDAPALVALGTVVVINSRTLMYSASLAPQLAPVPLGRRLVAGYLLVDQVYALSIARYAREPDLPRIPYYLGTALPLWVNWMIFTGIGAVLGGAIPPDLPLGFAVPLMFLALLVPAMHDRPTVAAGLASAFVATVAAPLPSNLGIPLAALSGIAAGLFVSRRRRVAQAGA